MSNSIEQALNKYLRYVENAKWHIETNNPSPEKLEALESHISHWLEVVRDLRSLLQSDNNDERNASQQELNSSTGAGIPKNQITNKGETADWKALREKFFAECTDNKDFPTWDGYIKKPVINIAPHDLFEWFKKNLEGETKEPVLSAFKECFQKFKEALQKIEEWELPPTGKFWDKEQTEPMSYGAAYGSNGERDYMRQIARTALFTYGNPNQSDKLAEEI